MTGRLWATQQMYNCTKLKGRVPCPMADMPDSRLWCNCLCFTWLYWNTDQNCFFPSLSLEHRFCLETVQRLGFGFSSALIINKIENSEICMFTRTYVNENIFINNCIWTTDYRENSYNYKSRQPLSAIGLEQFYYYLLLLLLLVVVKVPLNRVHTTGSWVPKCLH